ncbi:MAG: N-formylglutamate amidohydrolase [Thermodesulfobacteriota bacterium]|nr:N-formylglutamate amidohydrolase [Thermodesulfobacteriota bacterium]
MPMPILISVPHAGSRIPIEVEGICLLDSKEIIRDSDEGADEIYLPLESQVEAMVTNDVARAIVDVNRSEDDRGRDGVVKTHTCWDVPIYRRPPSETIVRNLIENYYRPYHEALSSHIKHVRVGLDCHTMAEIGPPVGPDYGKRRPRVCLSNADGTCPNAWLNALAHCFKAAFDTDASINHPFKGGFIIRSHEKEIPWVQIELSREHFISNTEKSRRVFEALSRWIRTIA